MDTFIQYLQKARQSIVVLLATIICALLLGWHQSSYVNEIIRINTLHQDGLVEVYVTGLGETRKGAENNAKRKALEKAIGVFIESKTGVIDKSGSTITDEKSESNYESSLEENIDVSGKGDFKSIDYLKYWQDDKGIWYVNIKAVVKNRHQE
jgi:hypothetical protein